MVPRPSHGSPVKAIQSAFKGIRNAINLLRLLIFLMFDAFQNRSPFAWDQLIHGNPDRSTQQAELQKRHHVRKRLTFEELKHRFECVDWIHVITENTKVEKSKVRTSCSASC